MKTIMIFILVFLNISGCLSQKDSSSYFFERGMRSYEKMKYAEAFNCFDKSILRDANYAEAYYYRGLAKEHLISLDSVEYKEVYNDFDKAIKLGFRNAHVYLKRQFYLQHIYFNFHLYMCYANLDSLYKIALADNYKALEIDSTEADAYNNIALILIETYKGSRDSVLIKSINELTKAILYAPNESTYYFNRAGLREQLGDQKGACEDIKKAKELGDIHAKDWYNSKCK